jgi:phosphatidylserine/phosphatidylglycerophosphate/cardiolipin synthase-like enzyme
MLLAKILQQRRWLLLIALIIIGGLGLAFVRRQNTSNSAPTAVSLPQHPLIKAYFNHNPAANYLEAHRPQQRPGDDLEAKIIADIESAQHSIDIAVQELKLPRIAHALVQKHRAGVKVRVILENIYSRSWSELTPAEVEQLSDREEARYREFFRLVDIDRDQQLSWAEITKRDALKILQIAQVPMIDDAADGSAGSGLMHHKFMVVDGHASIITSANWTMSDIHGDLNQLASRGNANNLLSIESSQLAQVLTTEFNLMWGDGPGGQLDSKFGIDKPGKSPVTIPVGDSSITIHFSPAPKSQDWSTTTNGLISQTMAPAQQKIDIAQFVFSEAQITESLQASHQRGIPIRALIDRSFAYRPYSQMLTMLGVSACHRQRPVWTNPITTAGVPSLPTGDLLHHKIAIIDQQKVIAGSHNWSATANYKNDETLLIVHSPMVAAHFQQEFDRLYQSAELGMPDRLQQKTCPGGQAPESITATENN